MPSANFGEKIALDRGSQFVEVKALNEKIRFQLIGGGVYDGKHFDQLTDGSWNITYCPRIMRKEECSLCSQYFTLRKQANEMEEKNESKEDVDRVLAKARKFAPTVTFYYPIINRGTEEAQILKTKLSIRNKFEEFHENGLKVLGCDYILTCTKKPGTAYYSLLRVDSSETDPFTDKEKKEVTMAREWELAEIVGIARESSMQYEHTEPETPVTTFEKKKVAPALEVEEVSDTVTVDPDEIPF